MLASQEHQILSLVMQYCPDEEKAMQIAVEIIEALSEQPDTDTN